MTDADNKNLQPPPDAEDPAVSLAADEPRAPPSPRTKPAEDAAAAIRPRREAQRPPWRARRPENRAETTPTNIAAQTHAANGNGQRFRLGGADGMCVLLTLAWLGGAAAYIDRSTGFDNFATLLPNEIGMFVAGLTAPVILLWFAVAYWRQTSGLTAEIRELRTASEQARAQSQSLAASEQHLRIDTYLKLIDFYLSEMAKHAAVLATHTLGLGDERIIALWDRFEKGDREVFFRLFFEEEPANLDTLLAAGIRDNAIASRSAHLFTGYWQVFLLQADQIDRGNLMLEAYKNGFLGELTKAVNKALYGSENPFS